MKDKEMEGKQDKELEVDGQRRRLYRYDDKQRQGWLRECDKAEGGPYEDNWVGKWYEGRINK